MFWERPTRRSALLRGLLFSLLAFPALLVFFLPAVALPGPLSLFDLRILFFYLWVGLATIGMVSLVEHKPISTVGLALHRWTLREGVGATVLGVVMACGAIVPLALAGTIELAGSPLGSLLGSSLMILLIASGEELLFRGYLFQRVLEILGEIAGVVIVALLFAMAHLGNPFITEVALINIFLVGILFGLLWLATRSLWSVIGLHAGWNLTVGTLFGLPVSGTMVSRDPLLHTIPGSVDSVVSGGAFGPEGSLITTGILILALLLVSKTRFFRIAPWAFASRYHALHSSSDESS